MTDPIRELVKQFPAADQSWLQCGPVQSIEGTSRVLVHHRKLSFSVTETPAVGDVVFYVWNGDIGCVIAIVGQTTTS